MDENNRNFITAIVLSIGVLFAWQYFFVPKTPLPPPGQQTAEQKTQTPAQQQPGPPQPRSEGGAPAPAGTGVQPGAPQVAAQTRDVSARGICFYLEAPLSVGSEIDFTLTLPPEITLTESIRVRCKGKVVRVDGALADSKVPVAAVIDEYEFLAEA